MSDERRSYLADSVLKWVWIASIVLALAVGIFVTWKATSHHYEKNPVEVEVEKEVVVPQIIEEETKFSHTTVQKGIRGMGELVTAEYFFTHVERVDDAKTLFDTDIEFAKSYFIYSYDGSVKAGVNFEGVELEVNEDDKIVTVTIPEAEIVSSEIDDGSFKLYDEQQSIFNNISVEDYAKSFEDMKRKEEEEAVNDGLLDEAQENAEDMIEGFLENAYDGTDYEVVIQTATEDKDN
ncbi:MAG: DUF4230 domain-containing protein [Lachnospiraceae bacterium]|nr:DUF4230 domain-containing protein [Lachnospiraceae bacterium]